MYENPKSHFVKRAQKYNHSSNWVDDTGLIEKIRDLAQPNHKAHVLDIAVGTGKLAKAFHGRAKYVVGIDICPDMAIQAKKYVDEIVLSPAERMPFKDNVFDVCVCRQGLQFMDLTEVLKEVYRVLRPKRTMVFCHLTAYDERDKEETFLIQKLRNPARKNFFLPQDFLELLKKNNFLNLECFEYITRESVNQWIDNGAIDEGEMQKIKDVYRKASDDFKKIHNIQFKDGDIFDSMKMLIIKGRK